MQKLIASFLFFSVLFACLGQAQDRVEWGEKFNSAGATLLLKETGRVRANNQTVVTYSLIAAGLPKDGEYTLWTRLPGGAPQAVADAFINENGLVVSVLADPKKNIAEDPINLKVVAGRGEPKQFGLIANDSSYRAFGQAVPFPIENTAGPCRISATMMARNYSAVLIVITGLQANEELQLEQRSGSEGGQGKGTTGADGSYRTLIYPAVKGQASGKLRFSATAKSCSVALEMPWGDGSYVIQ